MRHLMSQSARHTLRTLAALLLGAGLLAGCGQKGPLYLPADADAGGQRAEAPAADEGAATDSSTEIASKPTSASAEPQGTNATESSGSDV
ncbi:lipoprotein [Cobetia marina]|nr:lipoprotein [Cobetia marina]MDO6787524.1 lipoprotein [Cobetia marina]